MYMAIENAGIQVKYVCVWEREREREGVTLRGTGTHLIMTKNPTRYIPWTEKFFFSIIPGIPTFRKVYHLHLQAGSTERGIDIANFIFTHQENFRFPWSWTRREARAVATGEAHIVCDKHFQRTSCNIIKISLISWGPDYGLSSSLSRRRGKPEHCNACEKQRTHFSKFAAVSRTMWTIK